MLLVTSYIPNPVLGCVDTEESAQCSRAGFFIRRPVHARASTVPSALTLTALCCTPELAKSPVAMAVGVSKPDADSSIPQGVSYAPRVQPAFASIARPSTLRTDRASANAVSPAGILTVVCCTRTIGTRLLSLPRALCCVLLLSGWSTAKRQRCRFCSVGTNFCNALSEKKSSLSRPRPDPVRHYENEISCCA